MGWIGKSVVCLAAVTFVVAFPNENISLFDKVAFDAAVTKENLFVLFCKPRQYFCDKASTKWGNLHHLYSNNNSAVRLAQVNCAVSGILCREQKVEKVPVFRFFYKHPLDYSDFKGRRTFDSMHRFVEDELHTAEDIALASPSDAVVELGPRRFKDFVSRHLHFVNFYTHWCGHCKMLAPVWHDLALQIAGSAAIFISQLNCGKAVEVCQEYGIKSFPSLVLFFNGTKIERYMGDRHLEDLERYALSKVDELVPEDVPEIIVQNGVAVLTEDSFPYVVHKHLVFVNFHTTWCSQCEDLLTVWEQLANDNKERSVVMAILECEEEYDICEKRSINVFPTLVLYQEGIRLMEYTGELLLEDLQKFIDMFTLPTHHEEL